jgi:hypothetical protein
LLEELGFYALAGQPASSTSGLAATTPTTQYQPYVPPSYAPYVPPTYMPYVPPSYTPYVPPSYDYSTPYSVPDYSGLLTSRLHAAGLLALHADRPDDPIPR